MPLGERISRAGAYVSGAGLGPLLIRAVTGSGLVRIAGMLASFGVGVQLARMLGVTGYGYYGMALAVITIAGIPGEMGLPRLVTREVAAASAHDDMPRLFGVIRWADRMAWRISAAMVVALVIASAVLAVTRPSGLPAAILFGAAMVPFMALARIRGGSLQGLHHIVLGQVPAILLRPLLLSLLLAAAYLLGTGLDAAGAMALYSVTAITVFLVANLWLRQRLPAARPAELVQGGRGWLASSVPMALTDGMRVLQAELSVLLLGLLTTAADVGLFRIAIVTSFTAATPVAIMNHVAFPVIARLYAQKDMVRLQKALTRLAQAQFAGVLILSVPLIFAAEPLLGLVFGPDYVPAADALRVLATAQAVSAAFGTNVALLNMTHHERLVTRAMAMSLAVNFAAVILLALYWGRLGAALGIGSALVCWNVLTWRDARRVLGLETSIFPPRTTASAVAP